MPEDSKLAAEKSSGLRLRAAAAAPPSLEPEVPTLRLLTLNVWGLKYVSKLRRPRIEAIIDQLLRQDCDVIALQEVWVEADWQLVSERLASTFQYRRLFKSGIISGPGLAILSKIPIKSTFLYRFPINGRPSAVHRGDWYVGKSLSVTILANNVAILNSHMHAPYADRGDAAYLCHRSCQAWEIATHVKLLKKAGYCVVLVGDLNSKPDSLPYRLLTTECGLSDSWELYKNLKNERVLARAEIAQLSPHDQIVLGGVTCDSCLNSWRVEKPQHAACRLDYALIDRSKFRVTDAEVRFTELIPRLGCSYSDHFAYFVELALAESDVTQDTSEDSLMIYNQLIAEIEQYQQVTIPLQRSWRKLHFLASLLFVLLAIPATAVTADFARYVTIVMVVLAPIVLIPGLVNGMIAYLSIRSENRALEEVKEQVIDALYTTELHVSRS